MKKSKDFYKIQICICGFFALLAAALFIKGGLEWWTGDPNGFENATTICWFGTMVMSSIMVRNYCRDYQEYYGGGENGKDEDVD